MGNVSWGPDMAEQPENEDEARARRLFGGMPLCFRDEGRLDWLDSPKGRAQLTFIQALVEYKDLTVREAIDKAMEAEAARPRIPQIVIPENELRYIIEGNGPPKAP